MLVNQPDVRQRGFARPAARRVSPTVTGGTHIPYDYAAQLPLTGRPGNVVQDVIAVSPDAVFIAVAIGYGFEFDRTLRLEVSWQSRTDLAAGVVIPPGEIQLQQLPISALVEGFRVNPGFENVMFRTADASGIRDFSDQAISRDLSNFVFQRLRRPVDISFLFSLVDSSSGRELQDEPLHNLSSLGESTGERPFRLLARPLSFLPRSTIRVQVIERTPDITGTLFIVLYGYKIWTGATCTEPEAQRLVEHSLRSAWPRPGGAEVIPFDYVAKFELSGTRNNHHEDEITISSEGAFVATALGYGLAVDTEGVRLDVQTLSPEERSVAAPVPAAGQEQRVNLQFLPLRAFSTEALLDGIRIRKEYLRIALLPGGGLANGIALELANRIFERSNQTEEVSFRYTIYEGGTGQAWNNIPLNNIAGLGTASGQRPFKHLARPMVFRPRSTLRITVDEDFGRGWLYFSFQGYKTLGASGGAA
jgi:hypothetical protein